ncbi:hypothetical protein QZH41_016859 [Actinostola sp. cb2023]|nr:hypothetical protein QZH41_016859 [Actinostola sp. cb2023]
MARSTTSMACITLEVLFFFGVIILDVLMYELVYLREGGTKPFKRGFFCNDQDIMKPYRTERLSFAGILAAGTVLSLVMILFIELEMHFKKRREKSNDSEDRNKVGPVSIHAGIIRMLHRMGIFGAGMAVLLLFCQVVAILAGRLRPHFLAVCKPNTTLYNCSSGYITRDVCTGDPLLVKRARLSFPSLHTAASAYSLVFVAICLQAVACLKNNQILRLILQGVLILFAMATGLSRISRYYHHWSDVVGGLVLGAVMARVVVCYNAIL